MRYKLGEVAKIRYGKDHKKLDDGNIPVYGSGGIMRYVDTALYDKKSVLIPRKGSLGNLFFVNKPFWTVDTLFYTEIDENILMPEFLFYKLKMFNLASMNVGSAVPSLTTAILNALELDIPSFEVQSQIVNILKAFDERISLNKQINHHLEEVINAIFLRYIESSKQLEAKKLGELFDTKTATFNPAKAREEKVNHFSLPAFDSSQYPLVDETNNIKSNKNIIKEYSVLFSKLNPSTKRVWVPFTNQDLISVCSTEFVSLAGKDKIEQAILFAIINSQIFQDYFVAHATGTTNSRQRTKPSVAYEFEIPYNKNLLNQLGRTLSPLLTQLEDNLHQIHKLTQIRNELLPKLLSGKLSINQATK